MEIKEFTEKVRGAIERELGEGYRVELREVTKNNGTLLQGLLIIKEEGNLVPTIYLDSFYSEYQNGRSLSGIVQVILDIYRRETPHRNFDMDFFRSYELVKDRISSDQPAEERAPVGGCAVCRVPGSGGLLLLCIS